MKLSSCEDNMLPGLLNERLNAWVGLVQQTKTLDQLGEVGCERQSGHELHQH